MESTQRQSPPPRRPLPHDARADRPAAPRGSSAPGKAGEGDAVAGLWCPHCKMPFIGSVSATDGSFLHPACGGRSVLDLALLDDLAAESWFWRRYRDRLRGLDRTA